MIEKSYLRSNYYTLAQQKVDIPPPWWTERNGEEDEEQRTEHSVPAQETSRRVDHFKWSTDNSQILIAEYQAEGRNLDIEFMLIHEFKRWTAWSAEFKSGTLN